MKLNIAQCRSAKKNAAPRGLRRSTRISSSSSSCLPQQPISDLCADSHCLKPLQLSTFSSPCNARKPRTSNKREVRRPSHSEGEVFQPNQLVNQITLESLLDNQAPRPFESHEIENGGPLAKQRSFTLENFFITKQRSFKQENTGLAKQKSFNLDASRDAGISRQTSLKIEALIEPRSLSRTNSCTTIGRKRVVGVDDFSQELDFPNCGSPTPSSISEHDFSPRKKFASPRTSLTCLDRSPSASLTISELECLHKECFSPPSTPSTPTSQLHLGLALYEEFDGDSLLEELPFDLLLRIVCCLEHDDLRPVSLACKRLLRAVTIAQRCHFSYTTPNRAKEGKSAQIYLSSDEQMASQGTLARTFIRPPTPNAPRHSTRPAELRFGDVCPFASGFSELESPVLAEHTTKPLRMGTAPHRVLFDEDELCEAVAQNSL
ncbi:hypothetical protein L7F22_069202 [Adiantum nelumboides]|nr:hypothetical protein [Adiantum nelumboides]